MKTLLQGKQHIYFTIAIKYLSLVSPPYPFYFLLEYNCFTLLCQFLLYNKVISYMYTYITIPPPSCLSLPPSPSHPSRWSQSTELISLCYAAASHQLSILRLVVYICPCHSHFVPAYPSPSPCPQVHSLHLCLYSCPAPRFFRTIFFLDSIYMCQLMVFVFLLLHSA